ncbi:MAG: PQQ-like beta-propeller repeat protein [Planctomycetes bacterium]|nr:PQQ-like beta-propeller repeat protein [Planctomycetota bacterium]MBL7039915.1 PQQ-like beta-propeller repeat protein [Pirellulaceae bacterium]
MKYVLTTVCLGLAIASAAIGGENWTSYRGPTDQGHADSTGLPLQWSEDENVVWKTPIPGKAWSSPVIWGDRIWLTDANEAGTLLYAVCVDKNSGKVIVRKRLRLVNLPQYCHPFNSYASPSPVIEEGRVYVSFGSPYSACLDSTTGDVIWERTDFVCNHFRSAGSSPFLYKDLLILHFDGSDRQYVVAMDKHTGKTVWQTDRSVDFQDIDPETGGPKIQGDLRKGFSTPVIADVQGKPVLISLGSMALYGYEPDTGKELWRVECIGSHSGTCRPVVGYGLVFAPMGMGAELYAVRPDGRGEVTDTHVAWEYKRAVTKRPSILLVDDLLFMVDNDGVATCVEAKTGKEVWKERVGGNFSASPIYANGRIYFCDETGKSTIIEAAPQFKVLAVNELDDGFMGSPAVSGDALYLRTRKHLYRIEEKP